jgi:DNA-binding transcriptional ArsR family regulator
VSRSPLERLLQHHFRLDILFCLVHESLSLTALSTRLGKPAAAVAYHLGVLGSRDLVEREEASGENGVLYTANLDGQPAWVAEAVADRKESNSGQFDFLGTFAVTVGVKCDECEQLLRQESQIVALRQQDGERRARIVTSDSWRSDESASLPAVEKYHYDCYAEARERNPLLPPIPG